MDLLGRGRNCALMASFAVASLTGCTAFLDWSGYANGGALPRSDGDGGTDPRESDGGTSNPSPGDSNVRTRLALGDYHACGIRALGEVVCWGAGTSGQLGDGASTSSTHPVKVYDSGAGVVSVAARGSVSCAVFTNGDVTCWGANAAASSTTTPSWVAKSVTPVRVEGLSARSVSIGKEHACAVTADGGVMCWGTETYGQLGRSDGVGSAGPIAVAGLESGVTSIAAGDYHTCALMKTGAVKCWGQGIYGQLGASGAAWAVPAPVDVSGIADAKAITAGAAHSCAVAGGRVLCWGNNSSGELGNGTTIGKLSGTGEFVPAEVPELKDVVDVDASGQHTCALRDNGSIMCWGMAFPGSVSAFGSGLPTPSEIAEISQARTIRSGLVFGCVLFGDSKVKCWGDNSQSSLGATTPSTSATPIDVVNF